MENVTQETAVTVTSAPDNFVEYLLRSLSESDSSNQEEIYRDIIAKVWDRATAEKRKRVPVRELISNHTVEEGKLAASIVEAQTVITNTLRKMTYDIPEDLKWAHWRLPVEAHAIKVSRPTKAYNGDIFLKELTADVLIKGEGVLDTDVVQYEFRTANGIKNHGQIIVGLLKGDPIAVAQMVRKACKETTLKNHELALNSARKEIREIESESGKQLALLKDKIEALENKNLIKVRVATNPRSENYKKVEVKA